MSPNVFEINEDKIYKDECCSESYAMFFLVMLKKKCRTSKHFAGPVDAMVLLVLEGKYHFKLALRPDMYLAAPVNYPLNTHFPIFTT